jgi:DNA-binding CsgD family transcriptional regulator
MVIGLGKHGHRAGQHRRAHGTAMLAYNDAVSVTRRTKSDTRPGALERLTIGGVKVVYLSAPIESVDVLAGLTPAERAVARLAAAGCSNADIGRARGSSARTIANQLASIYRKVGVGSRAELIALLER